MPKKPVKKPPTQQLGSRDLSTQEKGSNMKRRVLLDIDGVCRDFITAFISEVNTIWAPLGSMPYQHDDVKDWHFKSLGLPDYIVKDAFKRLTGPNVCQSLGLYPGAKEGVARLQEIADVYAVTAPFPGSATWTSDCEDWLIEKLGIPRAQVVHTEAKHICSGDLLVEDKVATLKRWCAEYPTSTGILFKQTNNVEDRKLWEGAAVDDWTHLVQFIEAHFGLRQPVPTGAGLL
jgi:5'(3')-deoxyribonucleotidase